MRAALLAVAVLALGPVTATATPQPLRPGSGCTVVEDYGPSSVTGYLSGTVAAADLPDPGPTPGTNPVTVTLTCSIQSTGYAHGLTDDFSASGSGTAVAVVGPVPFSVPKPADDALVGVCGRADVTGAGGTVTYWSHSQNGTWRTTPDGTCGGAPKCLARSYECDPTLALVLDVLDYAQDVTGVTPPAAPECDVLAALAPGVPGVVDVTPEGDVYVAGEWFWDCPPHGS